MSGAANRAELWRDADRDAHLYSHDGHAGHRHGGRRGGGRSTHLWLCRVERPINLISCDVTFIFQKVLGYSLEKATLLMLDVHEKGRGEVVRASQS